MASIFEAPLQLASAPARTLDLLRRLGVDYVRVSVYWRSLAPSPTSRARPRDFHGASPTAYQASAWAPYDAIVRDAKARGIGVYFTLTGPAPDWAEGMGAPKPPAPQGVWKPTAAAVGEFVRAVGTRYSGRYTPPGESSPLPPVSFWSIWNEPNVGQANLAPQAIDGSRIDTSPAMYRALLSAGWSALHATGHGADTILIGELAPDGQTIGNVPGNFGYMVPLRFVRALYCVNSSLRPLRGTAAAERGCPTTSAVSKSFVRENPALFQASGYAVHPYLQGRAAPTTSTRYEPDYANSAALPKLERTLQTATGDYGQSRRFLLYDSEFGYLTDPPLRSGAPPALAAAYENWAEYISWRNPLIRSFDHYLLVDPAPGGPSQFFSGLEFFNGAPKATYAAFRMPIYLPVTRASAGHRLQVWGCVRPAHYARLQTGSTQRVQIEFQPRGKGRFEVLATVPITNKDGYFDLDLRPTSSGVVRLAWAYPRGAEIYSRSVRVSIR